MDYFRFEKTYFSRALSWVSLTWEKGFNSWNGKTETGRIVVRNNRTPFNSDLYYLDFLRDGQVLEDYQFELEAHRLTLHGSGDFYAGFHFPMECDSSLYVEARNADLRLTPIIGRSYKPSNSVYSISLDRGCVKSIYPYRNAVSYLQYRDIDLDDWEILNQAHGPSHIAPDEESRGTHGSFSDSKEAHGKPFLLRCRGKTPYRALLTIHDVQKGYLSIEDMGDPEPVRDSWERSLQQAAEMVKDDFDRFAWYNLWASFVPGRDYCIPGMEYLKYDTSLCTKRYMNAIWSWDHCFPALALVDVDPRAALEQFLIPFMVQDAQGALPDWTYSGGTVHWGVTKAPIHGLVFLEMMRRHAYSRSDMERVYRHLRLWTEWWMRYNDADRDGLPEYPQGCDCWDNATSFDRGLYLCSADLGWFLVLQMRCLEQLSIRLNYRDGSAERWGKAAGLLGDRIAEKLWDPVGGTFPTRLASTGLLDPKEDCLLVAMPIVAGEYLRPEHAQGLLRAIQARFLTEYGLATEAPSSPKYTPDGYWRGPTWAPVVFLVVHGLKRAGFVQDADELAARFVGTMERSGGMYENYDSLTGEGLCDPGYNWTTAVYFLLKRRKY